MSEPAQVKLRGVLEHTASWARVERDGELVVELYDFSPDAHRWLGNDVAFLLHVAAGDKARVLARLSNGHPRAADAADGDAELLRLVQERFADYYAVKDWLEHHAIPYRKEFEPWA